MLFSSVRLVTGIDDLGCDGIDCLDYVLPRSRSDSLVGHFLQSVVQGCGKLIRCISRLLAK